LTTYTPVIIDFKSNCCKNDKHQNCDGRWQGFGFDIHCNCVCHNKKQGALVEVWGPETNALTIHSHNNRGDQYDWQ
jgi:hypothetical protein